MKDEGWKECTHENKTSSTGLNSLSPLKTKQDQSNLGFNMVHAALFSSAACPGFPVSFVSSLWWGPVSLHPDIFPQHCARSKVFHVWYRIRVSYLWFKAGLITPDCLNGCFALFGLCVAYVASLIWADREVCVPLQSKHSLSCFPLVSSIVGWMGPVFVGGAKW